MGPAEIVGLRLVIRGDTFGRWFTDLSPDQQVDDIRSAFAVAGELPSLSRVGSVHDLADLKKAIAAVEAPGRQGFVFVRP